MRFLLIDDHPLMRSGLKQLIARTYPAATVDEAVDAATAMGKLGGERWDLILLDLDLPDRSGLDLLGDVFSLAPKSRVLVLSGHDEREFGRRVLQAGASGFIPKATHPEEILAAIGRVLSGQKYITPDLASSLLDALNQKGRVLHDALSEREFEVLRLFGSGSPASVIAERLGISVKTVSTYRARILQKLGLETTGEIVRYAIQNKLT